MTGTSFLYAASPAEVRKWAEIKFGLLAEGAVLTPAADAEMHDAKRPIRTRSGVSGGLDIRIAGCVDVNVPVREGFARDSSYRLECQEGLYQVTRDGEALCEFSPLPTPEFYGRTTGEQAEPMHRIGQMCSADRFCYGMTGPTCYFWARSRRCQYCTIGKNYSEDGVRKQESQMMEVLAAAVSDPRSPAQHVLIGGGTPPGDDRGALMAADLCETIKSTFPELSIYVMIAAPLSNAPLARLHAAGADEIGLNLEFWSEEAWERFIPGKHALIGKQRYIEALDFCVDLFGPVNTRSILIAGLEPLAHTRDAAIFLARRGVMPIVSPFRPLEGATLASARGATGPEYFRLWQSIDAEIAPDGIPLGPSCVACQNNTLALPTDSRYRRYGAA